MRQRRCGRSIGAVVVGFALLWGVSTRTAEAETFEGIVQPSRVVTLKAPEDERLGELPVRQAQVVAEGEVLAVMALEVQRRVVELASYLAEDQTRVEIAEFRLKDAELSYKRLQQMLERDAANEFEVLQAEVARDAAAAEVRAAKRQQEEASLRLGLEQERLDRHTVKAPFAGVVTELMTEAGASLTRDDPILELVALSPLEASFDLPDETFGRLAVGDEVALSAGSPVKASLSAVVDRIVPRIDPGSRTYRVVMRIDNADKQLPSGFVVELAMPTAEEAEAQAGLNAAR
ncbi:MAG: efflux RND transporter periplasmic adaptor subunit [Planctomycetota bacterium]